MQLPRLALALGDPEQRLEAFFIIRSLPRLTLLSQIRPSDRVRVSVVWATVSISDGVDEIFEEAGPSDYLAILVICLWAARRCPIGTPTMRVHITSEMSGRSQSESQKEGRRRALISKLADGPESRVEVIQGSFAP